MHKSLSRHAILITPVGQNRVDEKCPALLERAIDKLGLSARAYSRILKVARTIADLDALENIRAEHIWEAVQYRSLDRQFRSW